MRASRRPAPATILAVVVAASLAGAAFGQEQNAPYRAPGVTGERILFGQSAAFTGPAGELGRNMQAGILAAFKEVNDRGGVNGRRLVLWSLDDAYEPDLALANTRLLIREGVFALIGAVGTPTSMATLPVSEEYHVPYLAPMTGAEYLRGGARQTTINLRASYYQETEEMVERLTVDLGLRRIAILYQDDSFGRAGHRGVSRALERRKLAKVAEGTFPRNTTAVKVALLDLRDARPEAVIIIGPYQPTAAFIRWASRLGMEALFMTLSFVGSNALAEELGARGAGVVVTQVVPFPTSRAAPVAVAYRAALKAHDPAMTPGFISFEGYLAGRLAIHAVAHCGEPLRPDCLRPALRASGDIDLGGFTLRYDEGDNQGSDRVFLTVIGPDGRYAPITSLSALGGAN